MLFRPAVIALSLGAFVALSGCTSTGLIHRDRPDEFAVTRQAPLVVPPDFSLRPPAPGAPRSQGTDASQQALDVLFGGPAPRSAVESDAVKRAGQAETSIRSTAGDPETHTVAKGAVTRDILAAPQGDGREAQTNVPGTGN